MMSKEQGELKELEKARGRGVQGVSVLVRGNESASAPNGFRPGKSDSARLICKVSTRILALANSSGVPGNSNAADNTRSSSGTGRGESPRRSRRSCAEPNNPLAVVPCFRPKQRRKGAGMVDFGVT